MIDFRITQTLLITATPLNPPCQGDFLNLTKLGIVGKCLLIFPIPPNFGQPQGLPLHRGDPYEGCPIVPQFSKIDIGVYEFY